jgi:cell division protein FtsW
MARRVTGLAQKALYQPANPKPASFVLLLTLVTVLIVVGLIMVLSASSVESLREYGSSWAIFERQVLWVVLGAVALVLAARIDYRRWQRFGTPLLIVCLFLLLAVLVPGVGMSAGGSSRWLGIGSLRMQPSELAKLGVLIFGADLLTRRAGRMRNWKATVRPLLLVVGVACLLVIKQPDLGTALILVCITLGLLFAAGTSSAGIGTLLGLSGVAALLVALAEPYRRARLLSFLDPWAHASGSGYQVVQSLVGLGSGHLLGVGLGASAAKWGFLPNAYTDFIFSVLGEELGLIGALLVVGLFVALAVVGIRIAVRSSDRFGGLMAAGITTWIVVQAVMNIGGVAGMLPVTGVPLPFISFGGSSLVIMMAAVGVMLNVASREGVREAPELDPSRVRWGRARAAAVGVTPLHRPAAAVRSDGPGVRPRRPATPVARRQAAATPVARRQAAATPVARRQAAAPPVGRRETALARTGGRGGNPATARGPRSASAAARRPAAGSGSRVADPRLAGARARAADASMRGARAQAPPKAPVPTWRRRPRVTRVEL